MSWEAWFTLAIVVITIVLLALERLPPWSVMLGAVIILLVAGVVDVPQAFGGFANPAPITVAALYVLAGAAEATGALDALGSVLGRGQRERSDLAKITTTTAASSAVVNNTPLVAVMTPQISAWARRHGRSPGRYLMPLSFAAILGGTVTAIGTSTNLVVSGLLLDAGAKPLSMFEITAVGLPLAVVGLGVLILFAPTLLPKRSGSSEHIEDEMREYTVEMIVTGQGVAGKTVEEAGLRHLEGVFLAQIERQDHLIAPVAPTEILEANDRLMFAGNAERVLDLQRMRGIISAEEHHFRVGGNEDQRFFEAVVGTSSPLAGTTLKDAGFRGEYGGAVVALHRAGERVREKLGEVRLRAGDVLLVIADRDFAHRWKDRYDFLLVAPVGESGLVRSSKAPIVGICALAVVVISATGVLSILEISLLAAIALVLTRCLTLAEARRSLDIEVLVLIAAAFGVGAAITESGLAAQLGTLLVDGLGGFGGLALLAGIAVATLILTELVTNNAAAVLMFPIAIAAAEQFGLEPRGFAIAIAIAASASFLTPIGYQTNTMVYGVGGYRYGDFARVGWMLTLLAIAAILVIVPLRWPF